MSTINESNYGYPFELSKFQINAIRGIIGGNDVLVSAPTASGKTLPAEFAIRHFTAQGKRVLFASPIKALSNQKFHDFTKLFPDISVGIVTGDIQFTPAADVVILTTEILRNTLVAQNSSDDFEIPSLFNIDISEVGCIVFDECHYIGDEHRGSVWEQSILTTPAHIQLVMLSATLDNPESFAKWVERSRITTGISRPVDLCLTTKRQTPLNHSMWLSGPKTIDRIEKNKDILSAYDRFANTRTNLRTSGKSVAESKFNTLDYNSCIKTKRYLDTKRISPSNVQVINDVARHLKAQELTPAIIFVLSRKKLEYYASSITVPMLEYDDEYPATIRRECEAVLRTRLDNWREYMNIPECQILFGLLEKGIAIHHAGMLPVLQEMVEILFEKRFVKLLFATETFAVGLNMPARATVFTGLQKFNGQVMRYLEPGEYTQMAGRAGRRGIDASGEAIICANMFELPDAETMRSIVAGNPKHLRSKFRISYDFVFDVLAESTVATTPTESSIRSICSRSMMNEEIQEEMKGFRRQVDEISAELTSLQTVCHPIDPAILTQYMDLQYRVQQITGNQVKKIKRDMARIRATVPEIEQYVLHQNSIIELKSQIAQKEQMYVDTEQFVDRSIESVVSMLNKNGFVNSETNVLSPKGRMALVLREMHPLAFVDMYEKCNGFRDICKMDDPVITLALIAASFADIRMESKDDMDPKELYIERIVHSDGSETAVKSNSTNISAECIFACRYYIESVDRYANEETRYQINIPEYKSCHLGCLDLMARWFDAEDSETTACILRDATNRGIFVGDFIKGLLRVVNTARELELLCDIDCNLETKSYVNQIPNRILKFIATNQSLYVG